MDEPRTIPQNNALHLYFQMVADALNDAGYDVRHVVKPDIDIPWTKELVKNHLWRPVQKLAFEKESTTELLKQKEIDKIWEILNRYLSKYGVHIQFPSQWNLLVPTDATSPPKR